MFIQPYDPYKDLSLQSQVMVTRVIVREVGRQKGVSTKFYLKKNWESYKTKNIIRIRLLVIFSQLS